MKKKEPRLYDFRIKYSADEALMTNYHYYNCETGEEALSYQKEMIKRKGWNLNLLSIEKKNPFSANWDDESYLLIEEEK